MHSEPFFQAPAESWWPFPTLSIDAVLVVTEDIGAVIVNCSRRFGKDPIPPPMMAASRVRGGGYRALVKDHTSLIVFDGLSCCSIIVPY